ncbi:hypothetical protein NCCP28_04570 [Niallia sp. NCCP-28]|nr:hypothetical protein NCCP28_04570 [Niallia sp. NCCP-28]
MKEARKLIYTKKSGIDEAAIQAAEKNSGAIFQNNTKNFFN